VLSLICLFRRCRISNGVDGEDVLSLVRFSGFESSVCGGLGGKSVFSFSFGSYVSSENSGVLR
jgi:hypothetical protein